MYRDVIEGWVHLAPEGRHVYSRAVCFESRFYRGNNPCNLRYPFHLRFRQMAYIALLGLCWLIS